MASDRIVHNKTRREPATAAAPPVTEGRVLVLGATGAQGGSLARYLLGHGGSVRALTRRPDAPVALALSAAGAEVWPGDLDDVASLEHAMAGCDWVFGVTNFWEHGPREVDHGKNIVDAARRAKAPHLLLSTLESAEQTSRGAIAVAHTETKAAVEAYARASRVVATYVHLPFYFENFLVHFRLQRGDDGALSFGFPQGDAPLAGIAVRDIGPAIAAIARERGRHVGEAIEIAGDELRGDEYAAEFSAALGCNVRYEHVPVDAYRRLPFQGAEELATMFDYTRRFVPTRAGEIAAARRRYPETQTFASWARANRDLIERSILS